MYIKESAIISTDAKPNSERKCKYCPNPFILLRKKNVALSLEYHNRLLPNCTLVHLKMTYSSTKYLYMHIYMYIEVCIVAWGLVRLGLFFVRLANRIQQLKTANSDTSRKGFFQYLRAANCIRKKMKSQQQVKLQKLHVHEKRYRKNSWQYVKKELASDK